MPFLMRGSVWVPLRNPNQQTPSASLNRHLVQRDIYWTTNEPDFQALLNAQFPPGAVFNVQVAEETEPIFTDFDSLHAFLSVSDTGQQAELVNKNSSDLIGTWAQWGAKGVRPLRLPNSDSINLANVSQSQLAQLTTGGTGTTFGFAVPANAAALAPAGKATVVDISLGVNAATGINYTIVGGNIVFDNPLTLSIGDIVLVEDVSEFTLGADAENFKMTSPWSLAGNKSLGLFTGNGFFIENVEWAAFIFDPIVLDFSNLSLRQICRNVSTLVMLGSDWAIAGFYDAAADLTYGGGTIANPFRDFVRVGGSVAAGGNYTGPVQHFASWVRRQASPNTATVVGTTLGDVAWATAAGVNTAAIARADAWGFWADGSSVSVTMEVSDLLLEAGLE